MDIKKIMKQAEQNIYQALEDYRKHTNNANQGLNKSAARAAAIRAKIWRRRPERERTIEAD